MNSPEVEDIDRFFAAVVMPKLLACHPVSAERIATFPDWWQDFVAPSELHPAYVDTILENCRRLNELDLKVDVLSALIVAGSLGREPGYRELALIPLSDMGLITRCAQDVVIGAKHVVEDLDDDLGLGFGLDDEELDRDLATLRVQSVKRYCRADRSPSNAG